MRGEMIHLTTIITDQRARNGIWCCHPYPGHPRGCPNFLKGCTRRHPDIGGFINSYDWYAVIEEFDLKLHAENMKKRHPNWSERQCRNPLYWQGGVRANLRRKIITTEKDIVLGIPEACGINVFETMRVAGVILEQSKPSIVKKVIIVGRKPAMAEQWGSYEREAITEIKKGA